MWADGLVDVSPPSPPELLVAFGVGFPFGAINAGSWSRIGSGGGGGTRVSCTLSWGVAAGLLCEGRSATPMLCAWE